MYVKNKKKTVTALGTERRAYFDGIGKPVQSASNLEEAITMAGLNYEIKKIPVYFTKPKEDVYGFPMGEEYKRCRNKWATVRTDTYEDLGIVGKDYTLLQNREAFDFLDSMTSEASFESAGSWGPTGAKSFITMSTEKMKILGDEFQPYILFTNAADGTGAVKAMFTPMRVGSSSCYVRHTSDIDNEIRVIHKKSLKQRMEAAKLILLQHSNYLEAIKTEMEIMAKTRFTDAEFKDLVRTLFPTVEGMSDLAVLRNDEMIKSIIDSYNQADLATYENTAYRAVQAIADYESHLPAFRATKGLPYKNINNVIKGMPLTNKVANALLGG